MKNTIKLLTLFFWIFILMNFSFAYYCYQESSNETNQGGIDSINCSLNYGGTHYDPNTGFDWWYGGRAKPTDGNWSSYGSTAFGGGATIEVNYAKPLFSITSNTLWQIKDGNATTNLTIPDECMTFNTSFLTLRYYLVFNGGLYFAWWGCKNETATYKELRYINAQNQLYEEAIIWNTTATGKFKFNSE